MKNNYNLAVRDAEPLDAAVHGEHISDRAIVEAEAARVHQHSPVVCVSGGGEGGGEAHRARGGGGDEERKEGGSSFSVSLVAFCEFTKRSTNVCVISKLPRLIIHYMMSSLFHDLLQQYK